MKPIIGITMGCPVSIGPEIILKLYANQELKKKVLPVVIGDISVLERTAKQLGMSASFTPWHPGESIAEHSISVLPLSSLADNIPDWGMPTEATGKAMAGYITRGVEMALAGEIDGLTTCPIAKSTLNAAGFNYPGHTEMFAELTNSSNYGMMMAGNKLRVTLVTIHCAFSSIIPNLSPEKIRHTIRTTHNSLKKDFGIRKPKIAVAGVNPHAGEDGMFGKEEVTLIQPGITLAQEEGIDASGPYPPDTVFNKCAAGKFDAVVCMYHDQGLIPFKLLHFADGVNVTMGLPIVRTSVDHGTAYDIAGKGQAECTSLQAAVDMAAMIANNRNRFQDN